MKDPLSAFGKALPRKQVEQFQYKDDKVNWSKVMKLILKLVEIEMMKLSRAKRWLVMVSCVVPLYFLGSGIERFIMQLIHLF